MMFYYQVQDEVLVSREALAGIREITEEEASKAQRLIFMSRRAGAGKMAWLVSHKAYLAEAEEGLWCWRDRSRMCLSGWRKRLPLVV